MNSRKPETGSLKLEIRKTLIFALCFLISGFWLLTSASSALAAEAPQPGDACTTAGQRSITGGSQQIPGHYLVCDGATWNSIIDYSTAGGILMQIDNDAGTCTAAKTGRIRYIGGGSPWQYCNGAAWGAFSSASCTNDTAAACHLDAARSTDDADFIAGNIMNGVKILGITGTMLTGSGPDCTNDATVQCTLAVSRVSDDPDFAASNIRQNTNILGVVGSMMPSGGSYTAFLGAKVAAGIQYSCALMTDNTAWCWGSNNWSCLGDGYNMGYEFRFTPSPVLGSYTWSAISGSTLTVCAINASNNYPYCWGYISGGGGNQPGLIGSVAVSALSAGYQAMCYIKQSDSSLWCQGYNQSGVLGDGTQTNQNPAVQVSGGGAWSQISMWGGFHACGIKTDGTLWCWGDNNGGELGNGTTTQSNPPVQVSDAGPWQSVSVGNEDTCAIKTTGTLWCWGRNPNGELGNGTADGNNGTAHANPVQVSDAGPWSKVAAAGSDYSAPGIVCAIKTSGTLWCWGYGQDGALGNGSFADQYTPVQVTDTGTWTDVATYSDHACGVKTGGTVRCWGTTTSGQLGIPGSELNQHDVADARDFTPDAFSFTNQNGVATSQWIQSNIVQITGLTGDPVIWGDPNAHYRICNDATCSSVAVDWVYYGWTSHISNNQYLQLEAPSSSSLATSFTDTVWIGTVSSAWTITTGSASIPSYANLTNQMTGALVSTAIGQVSPGSPSTQTVSIAGGGSPQFRICSDWQCTTVVVNWTSTASSITIGQYLQLRMTTSASAPTQLTATVTIGTSQASWSTTTGTSPPKRVFVTSTSYTGSIGGVAGANTACAGRATAAGFAGTYKAWIAVTTGTDDPATTFSHSTTGYALPNGAIIASDWTALLNSNTVYLQNWILIDETYASWSGSYPNVWTNVAANGTATTSGSTSAGNCTAWTSANSGRTGNYGYPYYVNGQWTAYSSAACNATAHLYCFQQ